MVKATFNQKLALRITEAVGSMTCAYIFACIALLGLLGLFGLLPPMIYTLMTWFSQQFLQLVLLSVILLATNITSKQQQSEIKRAIKHLEKQETRQLELQQKLMEATEILLHLHTDKEASA